MLLFPPSLSPVTYSCTWILGSCLFTSVIFTFMGVCFRKNSRNPVKTNVLRVPHPPPLRCRGGGSRAAGGVLWASRPRSSAPAAAAAPAERRISRVHSPGTKPHAGVGLLPRPASAGAASAAVRVCPELGWGTALKKKKGKGEGGRIIIFSDGSRPLDAFQVPGVFRRVRPGRAQPRVARCRPPFSACRSQLLAGVRRPRTSALCAAGGRNQHSCLGARS